ncbi:MAG: adenylate/guanylate cyclase domain-containing protein [Alphaproteobacteria bacterium]
MEPRDVDRRLVAILAADIVGYSRLMGADEAGTHAQLKTHRKELVDPHIAEHKGRIVKTTGDGLLVEFGSVVDAVLCAVEVQRAMVRRNAGVPEESRIEFRIGVNLGDVIIDEDDIYGDGVNVAARLEGLAEPGGICVSRTVFNHVKGKVELGFEDLGEHKVKNIAEPISVYRVAIDADAAGTLPGEPTKRPPPLVRRLARRPWPAAIAAAVVLIVIAGALVVWQTTLREPSATLSTVETQTDGALPLPDVPSIAVLPFGNLSEDPEQEYFSDGMTNDIITDLSKISNLFVIASNSVFTYKGTPVKVKEVGRDLGVRYVLEGSVQRAGGRVRINAQLIDASTGYHMWAERYDRDWQDIFMLQDEITGAIVTALEVTLTESEQERVARQYTNNLDAYDIYLRGRTYLRGTADAHLQARELFEQAIGLDPMFAAAYAEKSTTYFSNLVMTMRQSPNALDLALEAAQMAVTLDDSLPLAHTRLAWVHLARMEHELAIAEAEQAVALDPNDAESLAQLGNILNWTGKAEEGIGHIEKAMRLDPHYPFNYLFYLGHAYYLLGRSEEAIQTLERVVNRNPDFSPAYRHLSVLYTEEGRDEEARVAMTEVLRINPEASIEDSRHRCLYRQDPELLDRFFGGMQTAGMPEGMPGQAASPM